jgi:hypothetical protein
MYLKKFCDDYATAAPIFCPRIAANIQLMWSTGCRLIESVEASRWSVNGNKITLDTAKRNNKRKFFFDEIPEISKKFIESGENFGLEKPQNTFQYQQQLFFGARIFTIGEKKSFNHLFRHNVARQKKKAGWTDKQIKIWLGEKNLISAEQYIYSDIFTNLPL